MTIQDSTKSISKNATRFFSGTLISRASGMVREVAMATVFGASPAVAAFWMAFRFAHLLRRLFGEGALHAAFVPHFESLREKDLSLSARFFYDLSKGVTLLLLFLTLFIEAILGSVLVFTHVGSSNAEVIRLTMLLLPAIVFISLYALNTSLLNCERTYFLPSVAPVFFNLIWIAAIFVLHKLAPVVAIQYLAMILVFAFALQWMVTLPKVLGYLSKNLSKQKFKVRDLLQILRPFSLAMLGVAATQVNSALDALFARAADPQGPAYLWYALRIQQLPLALFGVGLTGALLPPICRAVQKNEHSNYLGFLNFALKRTVILLLPMSAGIFALGFCGINLVFGHGAFSSEATVHTTVCLWAYGIALIPMTFVLIFASAFYAKKNYLIPTTLALVSVLLNVILNSVFVFLFNFGALSIALATSITACFNAALLGYFLKKERGLHLEGLGALFLKMLLAALVACAMTVLLGHQLFQDNTWNWLSHQELRAFPRQLHTQLLAFGALALSFCGSFFFAAYSLRIGEFLQFFSVPAQIESEEKG